VLAFGLVVGSSSLPRGNQKVQQIEHKLVPSFLVVYSLKRKEDDAGKPKMDWRACMPKWLRTKEFQEGAVDMSFQKYVSVALVTIFLPTQTWQE